MNNEAMAEVLKAFKLVCRKCGSDDCVIDIENGMHCSEETGYVDGEITAGCNACKNNDISIWN